MTSVASICCLCSFFASCSSDAVGGDSEPTTNPDGSPKMYTVSFKLGGDFISSSDSPLPATRAAGATESKKLYGMNVYYKTNNKIDKYTSFYAYGLFDNPDSMKIDLDSRNIYKFECSVIKNNVDTLYHTPDGAYFYPFNKGNSTKWKDSTKVTNSFSIISVGEVSYLSDLNSGKALIGENITSNHPRIDRFYGTTEGYVPTTNGLVTLELKRAVFGLKYKVTPPPEGFVEIQARVYQENGWPVDSPSLLASNFTVKSTDKTYETSNIYSFNRVSLINNYNPYQGDVIITAKWTKNDGSVSTYSKLITVTRNMQTTVNMDLSKLASNTTGKPNTSFSIIEESTSMGNIDVAF